MKLSRAFLFSTQLLVATSLPISTTSTTSVLSRGDKATTEGNLFRRIPAAGSAEAPKGAAENGTAAGGEAGAGGEGEKKENEKEIEGAFNVPVRLGGAGVKQDVLFPPGKNGRFEVEFQNAIGRTLTVTENRAPAPPPAGFTAVEAVSFKVNLAEGAQGMTLSKIDYILNPGNKLDISKGQIGRLFPEANAFIINPALGELEFEAEENELTLKVANMNGEFAVFLPQANGGAAGRA
ncbi:hypothetical protein CGLO_05280 [Colletotrichum gloeosporioides Cg-14]|uniref:Accumulation-associated protein n=2 Tax=Colletotrichum gloeosporioides species complex TaxID=2707338 RepID=T0M281_COLGC|nr:hypothetical protein CGLO_05280 [Colletotrichum gloeosporioides Cg-14]